MYHLVTMRAAIELSAEEAWAVYLALDDGVQCLISTDHWAAAAAVDQQAQLLWRKLNEEEP